MSSLLRLARSVNTFKSLVSGNKAPSLKPLHRPFISQNLNGFASTTTRCFSVLTSENNYQVGRLRSLDKVLMSIDNELMRNGRISSKGLCEVIYNLPQYRVSSSQALLLIRCCGQFISEDHPTNRTKTAHKIWDSLQEMGVKFDLSHYNSLLRVYLDNEHDFSPMDFLALLEKERISPNRVTHQRLIHRFCQMGDIEGASKILEFMKTEEMSITSAVFHSLMLGHSRANDLASAVNTLELMRESGHEPNADTYAALAVAQAERGDVEGIWATIALSKEAEQSVKDHQLMDVIYSLTVNGHGEHITPFLDSAEKGMFYNKDCVNTVCQLINMGHDDVAGQLRDTMEQMAEPDSQSNKNGLFFVRQLVKCDRPLDSIIESLSTTDFEKSYFLEHCLESALLFNKNLVYPLMDTIVERSRPVRPHYFWPLLKSAADNQDAEGVYEVVGQMVTRNVPLTFVTMASYILPSLLQSDQQMQTCIQRLQALGVPLFDIIYGAVRHYLRINRIDQAAEILTLHPVKLPVGSRQYLVAALLATRDYASSAIVLGQIRDRIKSNSSKADDDDSPSMDATDKKGYYFDVVGHFLVHLSAIDSNSEHKPIDMIAMLKCLKERGLSVSRELTEKILTIWGPVEPELTELLAVLSSGSLDKVALVSEASSYRQLSVESLEQSFESLKAQGGRCPKDLLSALLFHYTRARNVQKAEEVFQALKKDHNNDPTVGQLVLLMGMHADVGDIAKAREMYSSIEQVYPNTSIDQRKLMKLAKLLVLNDKIDEAVEVMERGGEKQPTHQMNDDRENAYKKDFTMVSMCKDMLYHVANKGDVSGVNRLMSALFANNFTEPSSILFTPLVNAHLVNNDLDGALDALASMKSEHGVLPLHSSMMNELIRVEDTVRLQKFLEMSIEVYGEATSLLRLSIAFTEEGKINQAIKIIQTPGLRINSDHVVRTFRVYLHNQQITHMENFLHVSSFVHGLKRALLFEPLLEAYIEEQDTKKAIGLWDQMQEENVTASDHFLRQLGIFLQSQDKAVPFTIPEATKTVSQALAQAIDVHPLRVAFNSALTDDKLDEAILLHAEIRGKNLPVFNTDTYKVLFKLLENDRTDEAIALAKNHFKAVIDKNTDFANRIFKSVASLRHLLNLLSAKGDLDTILEFTNMCPQPRMRNQFTYSMCLAGAHSGATGEVLQLFRSWLDQGTQDAGVALNRNISIQGLVYMLLKDPSLLPQVEELSEEYKAKGFMEGQESLWAYHLLQGNTDKVNELHAENSKDVHIFTVAAVCVGMRLLKDVSVAPELILRTANAADNDRHKGLIYSCWIDILCNNEKPEEALQVLETALKHTDSRKIRASTMKLLESSLKAANLPFPYAIAGNRKKKPQSSSSSSSDSD